MNIYLQKIKFMFAFTLAEVLITLAIVGVVAAMTLPVLINKIQDSQYERARAKILSSVGEAGRLLAVNGDISSASDAEDFVKNYLSKKLKIVKTCDSNNLEKCGLSAKVKRPDGSQFNMPKKNEDSGFGKLNDTSSWYAVKNNLGYGFVTANGYSINLFYNPNCTTSIDIDDNNASGYICFNAIYDMNGLRNPNQVGKDIGFVTVLYPNETNRAVAPHAAPVYLAEKYTWTEAQNKCSELGKEYTLPDKDELLAIAANKNFIYQSNNDPRWSSSSTTLNGKASAWRVNFYEGSRNIKKQTDTNQVICIKR